LGRSWNVHWKLTYRQQFSVFAVQNGGNCFGDNRIGIPKINGVSTCNVTCTNDPFTSCGGVYSHSLYKLIPHTYTYQICFDEIEGTQTVQTLPLVPSR